MATKKESLSYHSKRIIDKTAQISHMHHTVVSEVLKAYSEAVIKVLEDADEDNTISIKLVDGVFIASSYKRGGKMFRPDLERDILVDPYVTLNARVSPSLRNKIKKQFRIKRGYQLSSYVLPTEDDDDLLID